MQMNDWQNNTVAELIHGPADGAEIIMPPSEKVIEVIEVPFYGALKYTNHLKNAITMPERLGIYRRDGGTLRFHSDAPATVKFIYQETRDEKEPVE